MHHSKYSYVKKIVESKMPTLLVGSAGTGKTTMFMQIAEDLGLEFYSMSMTKQSSVASLLGFISITGTYIPSQLRLAYETGSMFLLDEADAADPNVLLTLNTIENGFISFPDKIVHAHPDFRLCATANPFHSHSTYTGRSKLDFSTIDRYFVIELERDPSLEIALTSQELYDKVSLARSIMEANGVSTPITMRDSIRMYKLDKLEITDCVLKDIAFKDQPQYYTEFTSKIETKQKEQAKQSATQSDATTINDLWDIVQREATYEPHESENTDSFTRDQSQYNSDVQAERTQAFDILQANISHNIPILPGWKITHSPITSMGFDEYIIKGPRFTHKFLSSEFIPF